MTDVFADSFYYIALLNPNDAHHAAAVAATQSLQHRLVTSVWVLLEVADALSAPAVRRRTHRFLEQAAADPHTLVVSALEPWYSHGRDLYGQRPDKDWSLTDCLSFVVMQERGITEVLTGDHHFHQAGFRLLLGRIA